MKHIFGLLLIVFIIYLIRREWRRDWMPDIEDLESTQCHIEPDEEWPRE